jgi:hypothetical protein
MTTPMQTEPPFVPLRHKGWATRRTPWWVFAVLAALVIGGVLVSLSHKPSQSQRASDLTGYFSDAQGGIGSCAASVRQSVTAYNAVLGGDVANLKTAEAIEAYGEGNCTVMSNEPLSDFANYQVTESLSSLNLDTADNDIITWAFDGVQYQTDMDTALKAGTPAARAAEQVAVAKDLATLNAEKATIDAIWNAAKTSTGCTAALPNITS